MNKIKVAIVINDFMVGGAQKLVADQVKLFDKEKFDICLITLFEFKGKDTMYYLLPSDLKVIKLHFENSGDILSWGNLWRTLSEVKPDVVVSHLFFTNTAMRLLKPFFGYKIITVEHNTYIKKKSFEIFIDYILSSLTYKIVAVSKTVKAFTAKQENISEDKFEVVLNGVDLKAIDSFKSLNSSSDIRKELNVRDDQKVFINVGRLTNQKNQKLLIESFMLYLKKDPESVLFILGEGALFEEFKKDIASRKLENSIRLMGARSDVYKFYMIADAFMSTSTIEGLSIAYLESLAFGVPIIATKTAGTDEIIKEGINGYFIEANTKSAVEGIEKFLVSADKLKSGALESSKEYSIQKNVSAYERLIEDSLKR